MEKNVRNGTVGFTTFRIINYIVGSVFCARS